MSGTRRTPIARPTRLQISARAVELFEGMEQASRQRNALSCNDDDSGSGSGYCRADCAACERWHALHGELHDELALQPWQWPVYARNPFCPGTARAQTWRPDGGAQAMWELLDAARCAARPTQDPGASAHAVNTDDRAD